MTLALEARKLADYISNLDSFETYHVKEKFCYDHIGALFTDIILQSGLNYQTVVKPRVQKVLLKYGDAYTTTKFSKLIEEVGLEKMINWQHPIKLQRLMRLVNFSLEQNINTCSDLKAFLLVKQNRVKLLSLNGIGPKTIDYTLKLLNFDTVAVDRHIYSFVEMADIQITGYQLTKQIVEYAADFLDVSRSTIDYSIWKFMSRDAKDHQNNNQLAIDF